MPTTYEPIATTTLGTASASITFSSIPSTYTDLRLVLTASSAGVWPNRVRFNSDTGTNYSQTNLSGDGSAASSDRVTSSNQLNPYVSMYSTPSLRTYDIFSYAGSTFKTVLYTENNDLNGSGYITRTVGLWRSTSAIDTILIYVPGGTIDVGTTATLYGIKNA